MATALQTGDILSQRVWAQLGTQASVNSYNYQVSSITGGAVTDVDFANALVTQTLAFYASLMADQAQYRGFQVYFLKRAAGSLPQPVVNITGQGNASGGTNALPRNTSGILKYNSFSRGPGGRGRIFLPFLPTDFMGPGGLPNASFGTLVNSFASALLTPVVVTAGGSTATLIWSLVKKIPATPPTSEQIIAASSADKFGQMHKRGDYGRANVSPL